MEILFMIILIFNYGISINLLIALPWILLYQVAYNAFLYDCWAMIPLGGAVGVAGVKIIHYNNKKMINLYNSKITTFHRNLNIHIHKTIKTFIEEHNEFCRLISDINRVLGNLGPYKHVHFDTSQFDLVTSILL